MNNLGEYLTIGDAAKFLGVSADTLRRWDRDGRLPARRHPISGYRLYSKSDLDVLLRDTDGEVAATFAHAGGNRTDRRGRAFAVEES